MIECECEVDIAARTEAMELARPDAVASVYPIAPDVVVEFPGGIPGFEQITQYRFQGLDAVRPFMFMEAVGAENVSFVCVDAFVICRNYRVRVPNTVVERLDLACDEKVAVLCLVTIGETVQATTANMMCPLIVNRRTRRGEQVILDGSDLPIRYAIWQALQPGAMEKDS
jgi:flagellar assembly factor FliW